MKSAAAATLIGILVLFSANPSLAEPVCGDVNDSGTVNTSDALQVLRKGVGQNVTLDCSDYDAEIASCDGALSTCSGNLDACQTDRTNAENALAACNEGELCGDGILNSVGEQCDEGAMGDMDCAALGYGSGELGCTEKCRFDTSKCSPCPEGSNLFNGLCWLLGETPDEEGKGSCEAACKSVGLECTEAILDFYGNGGTDENCRVAVDAADPAGAPHSLSSLDSFDAHLCGPATDYAAGCLYHTTSEKEEENGAIRFLYSGSKTLCEADYYGGFCGTPARRVCACTASAD